MSGETEKVTMKESELTALIEKVADKKATAIMEEKADEYLKKSLEEKIGVLSEETDGKIDAEIEKVLAKIKPDTKLQDEEQKVSEEFGIVKDASLSDVQQAQGEYLKAIIDFKEKKKFDPRLRFVDRAGNIIKTAGHMAEGDDSQGGFLVPEVFKADLQMIALENSIVRPNGATIIPPVKTDSLKIPYVNDITHASTVFGGVQAYWTAEAAEKSLSKPTFGQMELVPHKLAGVTYLSHELRDDSAIAIVPLIKRMFGSAWGYFEDDAFINGTGVGQPLGILNCNCLKVVLRNTANRVMLEDLAEMYACMLPPSHGFAIWVINPGVIPDLIELGTGNAADASGKNLIWIDSSGGAAKKPPMKILGRPVFISEKMQSLGTQGDIGYFDLRYYFIFDRQPITIDFSSHVAFTTDEDCWRFVLRVAGQCWPSATITPRNAAAPVTTQSPFVVLDANTS